MSRNDTEILETPDPATTEPTKKSPPPNWPVFITSAGIILIIALWAILAPENAGLVIGAIVTWVSANLGWYYILTATVIVGFVVFIAATRTGAVKLGPDHSKPQFNMFTWTAMLFAAGIGIDLMFYSVAEPVTQFYAPPAGNGETVEAARQAVVWTLFHYGISGWAMYALMGMAFAYFAYRRNMPLSIRSLLFPILGKRIHGWWGHSVDIAAVLGTVFGIATSLGIGVAQLNYGLFIMFGIQEGVGAQIGLIVLSVIMATISTVSGVEKGIRRLSELNVVLAVILLGYIMVTGRTRFLLDGIVMNTGDYISRFMDMTLNTFAFIQPDEWASAWTLFFWAWWIAWAPFVGLFLARISRGRSIRQFVFGVLVVPFAFILVFVSIFGNSALDIVLSGNDAFGQVAMNTPERAFYSLLEQYPGAPLLVGLASVVGLLFYVTSADSGALVLSNFTSRISDPKQDGNTKLRVFWAVLTGVLTLAMLLVGGIPTLQGTTLIIGLPFSLVLYLVMFSLYRALRIESHHTAGAQAALPNRIGNGSGELNWRQRLRRATVYPSANQATRYVERVVHPALASVTEELEKSGVHAELQCSRVPELDVDQVILQVPFDEEETFSYQVYPVENETPSFAFRSTSESDHYFRLEIFLSTGSRGYDVYGYTSDQLISDVLSHYESHLEFMRIASADAGTLADEDTAAKSTDWAEDD